MDFFSPEFFEPPANLYFDFAFGPFFYWRIFLRPMAIFFYGAYRGGMLAAMEPDRKLQKLFSTPPSTLYHTLPKPVNTLRENILLDMAWTLCALDLAVLLWYGLAGVFQVLDMLLVM